MGGGGGETTDAVIAAPSAFYLDLSVQARGAGSKNAAPHVLCARTRRDVCARVIHARARITSLDYLDVPGPQWSAFQKSRTLSKRSGRRTWEAPLFSPRASPFPASCALSRAFSSFPGKRESGRGKRLRPRTTNHPGSLLYNARPIRCRAIVPRRVSRGSPRYESTAKWRWVCYRANVANIELSV